MKKEKIQIISGMMIFLVIFLIYVVYYESNNIEVESYETHYLDYKIEKSMVIDCYKILGITHNEKEYEAFLNDYQISNYYSDKDFSKNYIFVAIKIEDCNEDIYIKNIKKNNGKYQLIFKNRLSCYDYGYNCEDQIVVYEIPVDKKLIDTNMFEVIIEYDTTELVGCENEEAYLDDDMVVKKPVLYLYPEEDTKVEVTFDNKNKLLSTYPKYIDKWEVLAKKDGTLIDENGREYYALYWDENIKHKEKFETGFYVKSEDSIKFLEEKLFEMGFTDKEANEFIMYWLPIMEQDGDNLVHFHFTEDRQKQNKINIEPQVDSLFRVSIEIKKVNKKVSIKEQKIERFERYGFSALEWGGSIIK